MTIIATPDRPMPSERSTYEVYRRGQMIGTIRGLSYFDALELAHARWGYLTDLSVFLALDAVRPSP